MWFTRGPGLVGAHVARCAASSRGQAAVLNIPSSHSHGHCAQRRHAQAAWKAKAERRRASCGVHTQPLLRRRCTPMRRFRGHGDGVLIRLSIPLTSPSSWPSLLAAARTGAGLPDLFTPGTLARGLGRWPARPLTICREASILLRAYALGLAVLGAGGCRGAEMTWAGLYGCRGGIANSAQQT